MPLDLPPEQWARLLRVVFRPSPRWVWLPRRPGLLRARRVIGSIEGQKRRGMP